MNKQQRKARNFLVDVIKQPYAWPGGYKKLLITHDGALLCSECCHKEASTIMSEIQDNSRCGWYPDGVCIEAVSPDCTPEEAQTYCDHCNKLLGEII